MATTKNDSSQNPFSVNKSFSENVVEKVIGNNSFYSLKNSGKSNTEIINWSAVESKATFNSYKKLIDYPHIPDIIYFPEAASKLVEINLSISGKKIGYIPGAGDKIPDALQKMGYEVTVLSQNDLTKNNISQFDAIVTGVRAYNIYEWLNDAYVVLMNYVKEGGVLLVQYNTNNNIGPVKARIGPFPFTISRNRVTEEDATVNFLFPQHSLLNFPNKITQKDFEGWVQERSTYQAIKFDSHYKTPFSMHDDGEQNNREILLCRLWQREISLCRPCFLS